MIPSTSPPAPGTGSPRRIAVFRALHLGDLLCATPALRALRCQFPAAEVTLIGLPWAADLVRRLPSLDRFAPFPGYPGLLEVPYEARRTEAFLTRMRAAGYDLVIQLHGDGHISNGFVAAMGASRSLGYRLGPDTRLTDSLPWVEDETETLRWLRLVALLGSPTDDVRLEFPITAEEKAHAAALLTGFGTGPGPLVGLHPGAKDPARRWPAARFSAVAARLVDQWDARVVLTGGAAERELTAVVQRMASRPVLDLAGQTDLGTLAAVIGRLDLLLTNDTGAAHLAAATATPSVVLFGPSRPERWAALDRERHLVVDARALVTADVDAATALARLPLGPVLAACTQVLDVGAHPLARAATISGATPATWDSACATTAPRETPCAG